MNVNMELDTYCCSFCYKNVDEGEVQRDEMEEVLTRFIKVVQRYFKDRNNRSDSVALESCSDCLDIVRSFCDRFHQLKCLELETEWMLSRLKNVMSGADAVAFRKDNFRESGRKSGGGGNMEAVEAFRRNFIKKCDLLGTSSFPKVELTKTHLDNILENPQTIIPLLDDRGTMIGVKMTAKVVPVPNQQYGWTSPSPSINDDDDYHDEMMENPASEEESDLVITEVRSVVSASAVACLLQGGPPPVQLTADIKNIIQLPPSEPEAKNVNPPEKVNWSDNETRMEVDFPSNDNANSMDTGGESVVLSMTDLLGRFLDKDYNKKESPLHHTPTPYALSESQSPRPCLKALRKKLEGKGEGTENKYKEGIAKTDDEDYDLKKDIPGMKRKREEENELELTTLLKGLPPLPIITNSKCKLCRKSFKTRKELQAHEKLHEIDDCSENLCESTLTFSHVPDSVQKEAVQNDLTSAPRSPPPGRQAATNKHMVVEKKNSENVGENKTDNADSDCDDDNYTGESESEPEFEQLAETTTTTTTPQAFQPQATPALPEEAKSLKISMKPATVTPPARNELFHEKSKNTYESTSVVFARVPAPVKEEVVAKEAMPPVPDTDSQSQSLCPQIQAAGTAIQVVDEEDSENEMDDMSSISFSSSCNLDNENDNEQIMNDDELSAIESESDYESDHHDGAESELCGDDTGRTTPERKASPPPAISTTAPPEEPEPESSVKINQKIIDASENMREPIAVSAPTAKKNYFNHCKNCSIAFDNKVQYQAHVELHGNFPCSNPTCNFTTTFAPKLAEHELSHHDYNVIDAEEKKTLTTERGSECTKCPRCDLTLGQMCTYIEHFLEDHLKFEINQCPICNNTLASGPFARGHLKKHIGNHHNIKGMDPSSVSRCEQCPAYFRTKNQLYLHNKKMHQMHDEDGSMIKSEDCEKMFLTSRDFFRHRARAHTVNPSDFQLNCDISACQELLETEWELELHKNASSPPAISTTIPPEEPDSSVKINQKLIDVSENSRKPIVVSTPTAEIHGNFPCSNPNCDFTTIFAPKLAEHELSHHDDSIIDAEIKKTPTPGSDSDSTKCPRCDLTLGHRSTYLDHFVKVHLKLEINQCQICNITRSGPFAREDLEEHIKQYHNLEGINPSSVARCEQCPAYFRKSKQLCKHNRQMHGGSVIKCKDCKRKFLTRKSFFHHRARAHMVNPSDFQLTCDIAACQKQCETEWELELHKNASSPPAISTTAPPEEPESSVKINQKIIDVSENIREPVAVSTPTVKKTYCKRCSMTFYTKLQYQVHLELHGNFPCSNPNCDFTTIFAPKLAEHELSHHDSVIDAEIKKTPTTGSDSESTKCPRCDLTLGQMCKYMDHFLEVHLKLEVNKCPVCNITLASDPFAQEMHINHQHNIEGVDPSSVAHCEQCPAYFRTPNQLKIHKKKLHRRENKCKDCEKVFLTSREFFRHQAHAHDFHVTCDIPTCQAQFETEWELKLHKDVSHPNSNQLKDSSGKDKLTCDQCGKVFARVRGLKSHMKTHDEEYQKNLQKKEKEKQWICEECGKELRNEAKLNTHKLIVHLGKEYSMFECEVCRVKCSSKKNLDWHARVHLKPFVCDVCGDSYAFAYGLKLHKNKNHDGIMKDVEMKEEDL